MRYVVIGPGAAGGPIAAGLLRDGHDVLACDAHPAVVAAMCAAVRCAAAVSGLPAARVLGEPAYGPLLRELARQEIAAAPGQAGAGAARAGAPGPGTGAGAPGTGAGAPRTGAPLAARAAELMRAVTEGRRARARENLGLLAAHEKLERLGRPLNAVVSAIGAPERTAGGPLAGQPVAVKDIIAVAGVPTRCGSPASDPGPAPADAAVVARLRSAGAEVFATSQCLEYAAGFAHPEVGDTRNPRDPSRTSGGSSGGSAALVAAGVCDLAIGTDTGGSVRIPAAYCGIAGLKPTYGLLPAEGVFPLSPTCDHVGTLTASASGAAALLAALAGPGDPAGGGPPFTVGVLSAQLADPSVTAGVREAVTAALATLAAAGWKLREITAPWLGDLARWEDTLAVIVSAEAATVHRGRDWARYAEGTRALLAYGASVSEQRYFDELRQRGELTAAIDASLDGVDVLAGPTVGYQAPEEDPPFGAGEDSAESRFTGPYNLTGHPAISIPVPIPGLPAGLQLAARRGADQRLLRIAAAAEHLFTARKG